MCVCVCVCVCVCFTEPIKKLIQLSESKKFNDNLDESADTIELEIVVS